MVGAGNVDETLVTTSPVDESDAPAGWSILGFIVATLGVVCLLVVIFGSVWNLANGVRVGAIVALVLLVAAHIWIVSYRPARLQSRDQLNGNGHLHHQNLLLKSSDYINKYDEDQLRGYIEALEQPWRFRGRLIENVQPRTRAIRQKVTIHLELPKREKGKDEDYIFPLMFPEKGELQDDLQVYLDGSSVVTYTHQHYLLLTIGVLSALVQQAELGLIRQSLDSGVVDKFRQNAEQGVVLVAMRSRLNDGGRRTLENCLAGIAELVVILESMKGSERDADRKAEISETLATLNSVAAIIKLLSANYAVLVSIPSAQAEPDGVVRRVIEYERYQIPNLDLAKASFNPFSWLAWSRDLLGMFLGARPIQLKLNLANAITAQSYHLLVFGPENTYVGVQKMPPLGFELSAQQGELGEQVERSHRHFQQRRGQRYLHVYMRFIQSAIADKLTLSVRFYEIPPGSMASATAAASAALLLTYIVAWITGAGGPPPMPGASGVTFGTDFPAVVLSFPAIVGAFAGFESRSTGIGTGTLASRVSSLVTIVCSIWATGLFVAQSTTKIRYAPHEPLVGIADRWWQVLVLVNLANFIYVGYNWLSRSTFYYLLSHRSTGPRKTKKRRSLQVN